MQLNGVVKSRFTVAFLLGMLSVLLLQTIGLCLWGPSRALKLVFAHARAGSAQIVEGSAEIRTGPWGTLEAFQIPLMTPDHHLPDEVQRLQQPAWVFRDYSESRLREFLNSCALTSTQRKVLLDRKSWIVSSNRCVLKPPLELVLGLDAGPRRQIYSVLANSANNYAQQFPFVFSTNHFADLFHAWGLNSKGINLLQKLAYEEKGWLYLSDLYPLKQVLAADEFDHVLGALYYVPAYYLRLRITPESDLHSLVEYWGKGGRGKLIEPLLEALRRTPDAPAINVSYLMPPFARTRLYTFPSSWDDPTAAQQDCFFTALNFFCQTPNTNFLRSDYARQVLRSEFAQISDTPTYGDLVLLLNEAGEGIHICVYIADDFVYTKNGTHPLQPWVLMRIPDMLSYYPAQDPPKFVILRRISSANEPKVALNGQPGHVAER